MGGGGLEPTIEGAVSNFFEGVFVEFDVGLPSRNFVEFTTGLLSLDGGFGVFVAFAKECCNGRALIGHGHASRRAS